jgi:TonB family protein
VLLALLLHGLMAIVFLLLPSFPTKKPEKETLYLNMVDVSELPNRPKLDKPPPINPLKKQVIDQAPPKTAQRPDKADYLSEQNQKIQKQTQAFNKGPRQDHPQNPQKQAEQAPSRAEAGKLASEQPAEAEAEAKPEDREPAKTEEDIANDGFNAPKRKRKTKERTAWVKDLRNMDLFSGIDTNTPGPPAASPDHITDVPSDAETRLNAWEWKHASFFNRMKNMVAKTWSPQQQIQRYDPQGIQLGRQDRLTVVTVTIDRSGRVHRVGVEKESGVGYLDEEATRAFLAAGPFPNPPDALFEQSEFFTFSFGFYLSIERGFGIHIGG